MDTLHKNFLSTSQVAELLGVSRVTIFRWIKEGTMKAEKVGRNYVIAHDEFMKHLGKQPLNDVQKGEIKNLVDKAMIDYGETIRMLGRE